VAANQPRRRPLAGQRSRSRLEPGGQAPGAATQPVPVDRTEPAPTAAVRPRRTAVLERTRTADAPPSDAATDHATGGRVRNGRRTPDLLLLVAGLVALALVLTAAAVTVKARGEDRTERARTEAVAAAESRAVDLLSYDYRHLDRDFGRAEKGLTGQFAKDYAHTTDSVVRPTAEEVHAVVKAEVVSSSVVRAAQNKVVVLLFVNQTTTSTRLDGPRVDLNRVRLTLVKVDGRWLVNKVVAL